LTRTPYAFPKDASRWSLRVSAFSMPATEQKRLFANGRSIETFRTTTSSPTFVAASLNRRSCASQTGVSSDGVTLMTTVFPAKSASVFGARPLSRTVKSGALSPTLMAGPTRVRGFPANVTTPVRSMVRVSFSWWLSSLRAS
jgi:hypothetical protein